MKIDSVGAYQGIQQTGAKLKQNMGQLTQAASKGDSLSATDSIVQMKSEQYNFSASAKVIKAENDTVGTILNLKA